MGSQWKLADSYGGRVLDKEGLWPAAIITAASRFSFPSIGWIGSGGVVVRLVVIGYRRPIFIARHLAVSRFLSRRPGWLRRGCFRRGCALTHREWRYQDGGQYQDSQTEF